MMVFPGFLCAEPKKGLDFARVLCALGEHDCAPQWPLLQTVADDIVNRHLLPTSGIARIWPVT